MRIAIVNWSSRRIGGVETYLNNVIPELSRAGHEISFFSEVDVPAERARIQLPVDAATWCAATMGTESALTALKDWRPDMTYSHKLENPTLERRIIGLAPSVFFAHDYNGTCISGAKSFKLPVIKPCHRRFGWQCLVHYFPHRCGGRSPITMLKLYRTQAKRLANLRSYDAIVTHSNHMFEELMNHGLSPQHAYNFPYYVPNISSDRSAAFAWPSARSDNKCISDPNGDAEWRLLFSGRFERLKGAHMLMSALPRVAAILNKPLRIIFAGDGRERNSLERMAAQVRTERVRIEFTGWLRRIELDKLLSESHLLIVPSLWPEPFGLVGPEAGKFGVPVAAFDVGGIRDWLSPGINGFLAPGSPPTSAGLAEAITKCLQNRATYGELRRGAVEVSQQFNIKNHLNALLRVFANVTAVE